MSLDVGAGFYVGLGCSELMAIALRLHVMHLTEALSGDDYGGLLELSCTMILEKAEYQSKQSRPRYVEHRKFKDFSGQEVVQERALNIRVNMCWEDVEAMQTREAAKYAYVQIAAEIRRSSRRLKEMFPLDRLAGDIERASPAVSIASER